jgi:tyrosyl-tRNA synthetase
VPLWFKLQPESRDLRQARYTEQGLGPSKKEAQRLMESGAVSIDGQSINDKFAVYLHQEGTILQVGKRKIVKLM